MLDNLSKTSRYLIAQRVSCSCSSYSKRPLSAIFMVYRLNNLPNCIHSFIWSPHYISEEYLVVWCFCLFPNGTAYLVLCCDPYDLTYILANFNISPLCAFPTTPLYARPTTRFVSKEERSFFAHFTEATGISRGS